jgi:hypothetical protein
MQGTRSYYAKLVAEGRGLLLGGQRTVLSSRFQSRAHAAQYLAVAIEANAGEGRRATGTVEESPLLPEILAHCPGSQAQAIGGLCFACRKKVTMEDARGTAPIG